MIHYAVSLKADGSGKLQITSKNWLRKYLRARCLAPIFKRLSSLSGAMRVLVVLRTEFSVCLPFSQSKRMAFWTAKTIQSLKLDKLNLLVNKLVGKFSLLKADF